MFHSNVLRGGALAMLLVLVAPSLHAQIVTSSHRSQLAAISDQAIQNAALQPITLGETRIDFAALTPAERAELIRLLADNDNELQLRAWDGLSPGAEASSLNIDQLRARIDAGSSNGLWWFEYVNSGRSAMRARWQLSRLPFPQDLQHWRTPPGLVAQGELRDVLRGDQANRFQLPVANYLLGSDPQKLDSVNAAGQTVTSMLHSEFPTAQLYLRIVAIGRSNTPVTLPSNTVVIEAVAASALAGRADGVAQISDPIMQAARVDAVDHRCWFQVTRALELPLGPAIAVGEVVATRRWEIGELINACRPAPGGLLGNFERLQGSAAQIEAAMSGWDGARFENAKQLAFDAASFNYGGPTGGCNSHCKQTISLALDQAGAVIGLPTNSALPDSLINTTETYLQRVLVDAIRMTDLPAIVHEEAALKAFKAFRDAMITPSQSTAPPFQPDYSRRQAHPQLQLSLTAGETEVPTRFLQIRDLGRKPRLHTTVIPIPSMLAGQELTVPIQLQSMELPAVTPWNLPSIEQLTADLKDQSALLSKVSQLLQAAAGPHKQLSKAVSRGNYDLQLAWRDDSGQYLEAARLRCKASNGQCKLRR